MNRIRKNLVRIEAMIIAVIMTVSMFANVGVNAAEITNDNIISVTEQENVEEIAQTLDERVSLENGDVSEDVLDDVDSIEEEIEVIETDEASEEVLLFIDEPEYILQEGGFIAYEEALCGDTSSARQYLYEQLKKRNSRIDITSLGMTGEQVNSLIHIVLNEHPDLYFVYPYNITTNSGRMYFNTKFIDQEFGVIYDDEAFERAVDNALSVVKTGMTDMEKAIALHDYLALNIAYSQSIYDGEVYNYDPIFSAYGALVNQDAVCQGYALAYEHLLQLAGVECGLVTSVNINHAWNYVKIDDQYYNVDVTWDDPLFSIYGDVVGHVKHDNMFKSDRNFNRSPVDKYDHTHQADDWVISINGTTTTTGFANDTFYDNFYWDDAYSQFVWGDDGKAFYEYRYIDEENCLRGRSIKRATLDGNQSEEFLILPINDAESFGLYRIGDKLYYSSGLDIVGVNINDKSQNTALNIPRNVTGTAICYNVESDSFEVKYQSGLGRYALSISNVSGINEYTVTFVDANETVLKKQVVLEGESATAPDYETPAGYTAFWSESFDDVRSNITVRLMFVPIKYTITYKLIKPDAVNGENPETYTIEDTVAFEAPTCTGYIFNGWYPNEMYSGATLNTFSGKTGNIVLYAKWTPVKPTAPEIKAEPSVVLPTGNILVDAGTVVTIVGEEKANVRYTTDGSNPTATSKIYTGGIVINEKTTINAICERDSVVSQVASKTFVIANNEFALQDDVALEAGETHQITAVTLPTSKAFTDISFSSSNNAVATVSDSGVITAEGNGTAIITAIITDWRGRPLQDTLEVAVTKNCKVTFVGFDNNVIKEQVVRSGESAEAPDMSSESLVPNGYEFKCWDKPFVGVTEDVTVYARFETKTYYIFFVNDEGENPPFKSYDIVSEDIVLPDSSEMTAENKNFVGWYDNEAYEGSPISKISAKTCEDIVLYAKWATKATLTMEWDSTVHVEDGVAFLPYTGKAQTPAFTVYYGDTKLENKKDYTYKFANNVNAYILDENDESLYAKKAPVLIITGKGNYAGTERVYFNIERKRIDILDDSEIDIVPVSLAYNKKVQKVAPVVTWNSKKLTTKELSFNYNSVGDGVYINVGSYNVEVVGKGNFEGTRNVALKIFNTNVAEADTSILIKSCKVSITPFDLNNSVIDFTDPEIRKHIKVTRGKEQVPYSDKPNVDGYDIKLVGTTEAKDIGTYTVCVSGNGIYKGEVRTTFKINGLNVSTMKVEPIPVEIYDGKAKTPVLKITSKSGDRLHELDEHGIGEYTLEYQKNVDVGTATVIITGKNAFYGTRKVTFKINQKVMAADSSEWDEKVEVSFVNPTYGDNCYDYVKGGVTPKLKVVYKDTAKGVREELVEKTDYTLAYKYNTSANPVVGKEPYVVLTLKKNIKGTKNIRFDIAQKDLDDEKIVIKVNDILVSTQPGKYKSTPAIYDTNGKKLDSKDYEAAFVYTYPGSETPLDKYSKPESGQVIKVTVKGKGNYKGSKTGTYRVYDKGKSIASASIKVKPEVLADIKYNGQPVVLDELNDLEVKIGKTTVLRPGIDYKIDEKSYVNNVNKGTAKVTIVGNGEYAGSKTITFSIKPWYLKWWEKLAGN